MLYVVKKNASKYVNLKIFFTKRLIKIVKSREIRILFEYSNIRIIEHYFNIQIFRCLNFLTTAIWRWSNERRRWKWCWSYLMRKMLWRNARTFCHISLLTRRRKKQRSVVFQSFILQIYVWLSLFQIITSISYDVLFCSLSSRSRARSLKFWPAYKNPSRFNRRRKNTHPWVHR